MSARSSWPLLFGAGLLFLVAFLLWLPYLPLQDYPQHRLVLELAAQGGSSLQGFVARSDFLVGYRLHVWLCDVLAPLLGVDAAVRTILVASVAALPVCIAMLARRLGGDGALAGILALPLMFSWPVRMGFMPYLLSLPFAFFMVRAAVAFLRDGDRRSLAWLSGLACLGYAAHPFAPPLGAAGCLAIWLCCSRSWRTLVALAVAAAPCAALSAFDALRGAFTDSVVSQGGQYGLRWSTPTEAVEFLLACSFGAQRPAELIPHAGMYLVVGVASGLLARRTHIAMNRCALLLVAVYFLAYVAVPLHGGVGALLSPRLVVVLFGALVIAASRALERTILRVAALVAVVVSLAATLVDLRDDARRLEAMLGEPPPRISARVLPVRAARCAEPYRMWDPLLHAWGHVVTPDAFVPHLFAFSPFHPVTFRDDPFVVWPGLPVTPYALTGFESRRCDDAAAAQVTRARVRRALALLGFQVLLYGDSELVDAALAGFTVAPVSRLAPGVVLIGGAHEADAR